MILHERCERECEREPKRLRWPVMRKLFVIVGDHQPEVRHDLPHFDDDYLAHRMRGPKVRTSHHRNAEEARRLQALVDQRIKGNNA
jgi:hypothetical protein